MPSAESVGARQLHKPSITSMAQLLVVCLAIAAGAGFARAQQPSRPRAAFVTGTYASGTKQLPASHRDGCWLEAAPTDADSVHIQVLCRKPAPGYHLGVLDARLPLRGDTLIYERSETAGNCRIRTRFAAGRALVTQEGSDSACGFGAFVDVSGTYLRLDRRRPPFDLAPIERASRARAKKTKPAAPHLDEDQTW